jgi:ribosomal protein S6--L-glutamate ligase
LRFAVVARSWTPTNVGLASCAPPGIDSMILAPSQALEQLRPGDVALGRLDVLETLDGIEPGLWVLHQLEELGVRVLNRPQALIAGHDKVLTARILEGARLPHPRTVLVTSPEAEVRLEPPLVVKPRFGSWGVDVVRCDDRAALRRTLGELSGRTWFGVAGAVVQELVTPQGYDLRLIVSGGSVVGAIERVAAPGEWRTNISLGSTRRSTVPTPEACALAVDAAAAIGGDLVGVDLLPTEVGAYVVLELNSAVDFTPEYSQSDGDVFRAAVARLSGLGDEATAAA